MQWCAKVRESANIVHSSGMWKMVTHAPEGAKT